MGGCNYSGKACCTAAFKYELIIILQSKLARTLRQRARRRAAFPFPRLNFYFFPAQVISGTFFLIRLPYFDVYLFARFKVLDQ